MPLTAMWFRPRPVGSTMARHRLATGGLCARNDDPMTEPNESGPTPPAGAAAPPPAPPARPPATDWREPPWFPPRDQDRQRRRSNLGAIVIGLIILGIGVYYFFDRTLGIAMPRIQWGSIWPVFVVILGGLILLRAFERR